MNTIIINEDVSILGIGADSIVFVVGSNKSVIKAYRGLTLSDLQRYHQIQAQASRLVRSELEGVLSFQGAFEGKRIQQINLRVLDLTQGIICGVPQKILEGMNAVGYLPGENMIASHIPYIGGQTLDSYKHSSNISNILSLLNAELMNFDIPLGGANGLDGLHPVNIKVFPGNKENSISLVITDIGASVRGILSQTTIQ